MRAILILALALQAGCSYCYRHHLTPPATIPEASALERDQRPTVLVRYSFDNDVIDDFPARLSYLHAFTDSGLFARVDEQMPDSPEQRRERTDLTIDVQLDRVNAWHWYCCLLGWATLTAIPVPAGSEIELHAILRDEKRGEIARLRRVEKLTRFHWAPLLPFTLLGSLLHTGSPVTIETVESAWREDVENMGRSALAEWHARGLLRRAPATAAREK